MTPTQTDNVKQLHVCTQTWGFPTFRDSMDAMFNYFTIEDHKGQLFIFIRTEVRKEREKYKSQIPIEDPDRQS